MAVAREARGRGISRALHEARLEDVRAHGLAGLFADSVYAGRQDPGDREAEARVGTDPLTRRRALNALGYRTVDAPYWQPVGGPDGGPLTDLDLIYNPLDGGNTVPTELVTGTLRAYWDGWLGKARAEREAAALAERAGNPATLALLPATETPHYWRGRGAGEAEVAGARRLDGAGRGGGRLRHSPSPPLQAALQVPTRRRDEKMGGRQ